jgi:hypothetical protein
MKQAATTAIAAFVVHLFQGVARTVVHFYRVSNGIGYIVPRGQVGRDTVIVKGKIRKQRFKEGPFTLVPQHTPIVQGLHKARRDTIKLKQTAAPGLIKLGCSVTYGGSSLVDQCQPERL